MGEKLYCTGAKESCFHFSLWLFLYVSFFMYRTVGALLCNGKSAAVCRCLCLYWLNRPLHWFVFMGFAITVSNCGAHSGGLKQSGSVRIFSIMQINSRTSLWRVFISVMWFWPGLLFNCLTADNWGNARKPTAQRSKGSLYLSSSFFVFRLADLVLIRQSVPARYVGLINKCWTISDGEKSAFTKPKHVVR